MADVPNRQAAESIRNIAMVGHAGAGKTTLIEELLALSGAIPEAGSVASGSTVTDHSAAAKRAGHSLDVSVCHLEHAGRLIHLLDTPGYPDFFGRTLSVLPAVETAAIVVNARHGIEYVTREIMAAAAARNLCRLIIVNQCDAPDARPEAALAAIRESFGRECLPLNLPAGGGSRIADCFFEPADTTPDFSSVAMAHTAITDQVIELDDKLMEVYLEQGESITPEQLHDPFERALRGGHLIPVCFTSAKTRAGLKQLLRVFATLMPSPLEGNPTEILAGSDRSFRTDPADVTAHFVGHVFKIAIDPYVGRLASFRVHQGTLRTGDQIFIGDRRKGVKIAHIYHQQGARTRELPQVAAGDICALAKIDGIEFNDVLHASHDEDSLVMPRHPLPEPNFALALTMSQRGQEKKLAEALHKLAAEDASLAIEQDTATQDTVLRGLGELHLRSVLERLRGDLGVDVETRTPRIPYRETVTRAADGHCRHKKQTGGAGQFGEVHLKIEPLARGAGFEFVDETVGGSIPGQYIPAVEKGIRQVLSQGAVTGNPMQDLRVVVYDGKHHPVDSKEVAFIAAGRKAFLDAVGKAGPVVLEPIARIEVTLPGRDVGDVSGQLAGIRGRIMGNETATGNTVRLTAEVPLAELSDFQVTLKSLTGGEGRYTLKLDHYDAAPPAVQRSLEAAYRPQPEA
jgi:elongation factor G